VAYLRFDDTDSKDGAAARDAVGRHPGAYRGGVRLEGGVPGIRGKAARLDGTSAYVEVADHADFRSPAISVEFWFRASQPWNAPFWPASAALVSKATLGNGSSDWAIVGGATREGDRQGCIVVGVGPKPGTDTLLNSPAKLNDGAWHHVAWTRAATGENKLYIDGGLAAVASDGGGAITNDRPIQIGGDPWLKGKFLDGLIAEVALYNKALDGARIKAHAAAGGIAPKEWPMPKQQPTLSERPPAAAPPRPFVLRPDAFRHHVDSFNQHDRETVVQHIPNASAWAWMRQSVPLFECPDTDIEEVYYFRWWTYRKQIRLTPDGFVVTEFLPQVGWSGKHNTINCAAGHHIYEGRWIRDARYVDDYSVFWFRKGGEPRRYSFWAADACYARYLVDQNKALVTDLLPDLIRNYDAWEKTHQDPNGLFWQIDDRDGMEVSIGGSGYRATINSYMYGDAAAIAKIAELAGKNDAATAFREKAAKIRQLVLEKLWDADAQFFKVLPRGEGKKLADVREEHGYTPWYFNLPDPQCSIAWKQVMDPQGFYAPFGPTTAERRHPRFMFKSGHECLWNGPSWPYATSVTLTAMANLLNNYQQDFVGKKDYLDLLRIYAKSQHIKLPDGTVVPWIDEDLHPDTGDWIARSILEKRGVKDRGKDYNHSSYCDLVITGLVGLRPRSDEAIEVHPLVSEGTWDYFCLDQVLYHGRSITILYDKTGERYKKGKGLRVFADGKEIAVSEKLGVCHGRLADRARLGEPSAPLGPGPAVAPLQDAETAAGWVKSDANPVLGGKLGTCFDVSLLKEGGTFRMWFSWRPRKSLALVESADGIHWGEPAIVLGPNPATKWEDDINRPVVVKRPDGYHLWYTGQARGHSWIGYATSPDGKSWKRMSDKPVLSPDKPWEKVAVMCPHVLWDEQAKLYRMWYSGGEQYEPDALGYATSPDGLVWTKRDDNPVFRADPKSPWEQHKVTACQVVRHGDWHLMFYIGFRDSNHAQIGLARSKDGITGWERHPDNPIIRPGKDRWDHDACYKPFAIWDGKRWLLWYNGRRGGLEQIGLAIHEGEVNWGSALKIQNKDRADGPAR